jgi:lipopolysaccharide transport system permease protein
MKNPTVTVYNKDTRIKSSIIEAFIDVFRNAWSFRWLIWTNIKKDLTAPYKQSFFGILWSFIIPIIPITAYILLGYMNVLSVRGGMPFPVYIMVGMTSWSIFAGGVRSLINKIEGQRTVITKIKVPFIVFVLSSFGMVCSDTLIRFIFVVMSFALYKIIPSWHILFLPIVVLPIVLLSFGVGVILSFLNVVIKDIRNIANMLLTYGMFFSSVIFPMPTSGVLGKANLINIPNHFVVAIRDFMVVGRIRNTEEYLFATFVSLVLFIISVKSLYSLEYKIVGHL